MISGRRATAWAAIATIAGVGGAAGPASAAPAAPPCQSSSFDDYDHREYAKQFRRNVQILSGPAENCAEQFLATPNNLVDYHCWTRAWDGTTWTYLRTATTVYGWVWDGDLKDGGSTVNCPHGGLLAG
ncbi:hypothetical protein [Actinoplanes solisilvae]|uniref:hypothetical protein n=1 Tax=Actinoplanes solisilvae TaxID=2486853 RepID=UPI000FD6E52D|nr:hypothetical protein [Actinoplanes solisilvae]